MKSRRKVKPRVLTSEKELAKAVAAARAREKKATKIRSGRYDSKHDLVIAELSTGATLAVPRRAIPGFARVRSRSMTDLCVTPGAEGLWSDAVDDGVLLEQLIILAAGERMVGSIGARVNASKKSLARAAASRANGAKGGRPRKSAA